MYLNEYQIGDPFDTRLMINQHEHWFRFFSGNSELRDTYTFYPFDKALGFTDAFLISGLIHSSFRAIDFSVVDAWSIATFLFFLSGNVGWVFVAKRLLTKKFSQFAFVLTVSSTPTLVLLLERAPNAAGYSWLSWLLYFTVVGIDQIKLNKSNNGFGIVSIILPALMLSSWYPGFFYMITVATSLGAYTIFNIKKGTRYLHLIKKSIKNFKSFKFYLPGSALLFGLWAYIHIPVAFKATRSWDETIANSTYLSQIVNQGFLNNGWYYIFVKKFEYESFQNSNFAIPILILILTLVFFILSFFFKTSKVRIFRNYFLIPGIVITLLFTRLSENFSVFKIFWEYVPGFYSIRFPYRYSIVFSFIALIFIFICLDHLLQRSNKAFKQTISYAMCFFLIVDLYKPPLTLWKKDGFVPKELLAQERTIKENCDFFVLDRPGGWWDDQITAMSLSTIIGVPTANGYSGSFPQGYPVKNWHYEGDISGILMWSNFGKNSEIGCLISDSHELISSAPREPKMVFHSGFSPPEEDQKGNYWRWAEHYQSNVILSTPNNIKEIEINMVVKLAECLQQANLFIYKEPNQLLYQDVITPKSTNINFFVENNFSTIIQLKLELENQYCQFEGDPRNLYFEVKNYEIRLND